MEVIGVPGYIYTVPPSFNSGALATAAALTTVDTEVGLIQTDLDNATDGLGALKALIDALNDPTAAAVAVAVWDAVQASHVGAGTFGVIATEIAALQTDLDNATDGLGALKALIDTVDSEVGQILADTGTDGVVLNATQMNQVADHVWRRTLANIRASSDGDTLAFRTGLGALSKLVNRVGITGANLLTYEEDDTTTFGTQALTTDAAAEPITDINTV